MESDPTLKLKQDLEAYKHALSESSKKVAQWKSKYDHAIRAGMEAAQRGDAMVKQMQEFINTMDQRARVLITRYIPEHERKEVLKDWMQNLPSKIA